MQELQKTWSIAKKVKSISAEDKDLDQDMGKLVESDPSVSSDWMKLEKMFHQKVNKFSKQLKKTGHNIFDIKKYEAKLDAFKAEMDDLDQKAKKALNWGGAKDTSQEQQDKELWTVKVDVK